MSWLRKISLRAWVLSIAAGMIFSLFALAPQIHLWANRGDAWNGSFAISDYDEPAYAAYVQSLIDGKPLRNSPYTGVTSETRPDLPQSLFSIQFLASLPTALIARILGIDASTAMILLSAVSSFLAAMGVLWLLYLLTGHAFYSFGATILVLTLGSMDLEATHFFQSFLDGKALTNMQASFMRRSVPAISFPVLIAFHFFVLKFFDDSKKGTFWAAAIISSFAVLIYSYLFHWTVAAAWITAFALLMLIFKKDEILRLKATILAIGSAMTILLIPYVLLVTSRGSDIDSVQLFVNTRMPDLLRVSELIGLLSTVLIFAGARNGLFVLKDTRTLFLISMNCVPFIVFNQQILTGLTFQPFHYSIFAVNYTVLISLCAVAFSYLNRYVKRSQANRIFVVLTVCGIFLGSMGTVVKAMELRPVNLMRDKFAGVAKVINKIEQSHGGKSESGDIVFFGFANFTYPHNDDFPMYLSIPVLWSPHQIVYSDLSRTDTRSRIFAKLHLEGIDMKQIRENIKSNPILRRGLFGWGREDFRLSGTSNPISKKEMGLLSESYSAFRNEFDSEKARKFELKYLVTYEAAPISFDEIDRWYKRTLIVTREGYRAYRLRLRKIDLSK
ncbi:MAG: hypothetical protein HKN33_05580 [Pyrinomonadaceae bacterium]|nr:hypothetical protein [Pyrinomonadaceae bacterium]